MIQTLMILAALGAVGIVVYRIRLRREYNSVAYLSTYGHAEHLKAENAKRMQDPLYMEETD